MPVALPIDPLLAEICAQLERAGCLVLRADPGAGKTTRVPAALLAAGVAGDKDVVVLEPRRVAARAAADFVSRERGQPVGRSVGYRVRFDQKGGAHTRLWFLTEGVLGRQLAADPFLERVGVLVLDEFHERHLQGDVALAVARELRRTVRPDLKIAVMSATLQTAPLAAFLGDCPVIDAPGRTFPVAVHYAENIDDRPLAGRVAAALRRALREADDGGDVLVFLPGAAEIRRAGEALAAIAAAQDLEIVILHGDLPLEAQMRALRRGTRRKVILATNVAETSLTIEGVTTVIDSGLARRGELDPRLGINRLQVLPISRAAAEQRAGRAGRTAPGRCFRLWTRHEHAGRRENEVAEVHRLDLSPTLLELRAWGLRDVAGFAWLEPPRPAALNAAESLLVGLGAVGPGGELTPIGKSMSEIPAHPRAARLLVEARARGAAAAGAGLAALISERDILSERRAFAAPASARSAEAASDLLARLELLERAAAGDFDPALCRRLGVEMPLARAAWRARAQFLRATGGSGTAAPDEETLLRCVLVAYPDRVARRRAPGSPRAVMVGGTGVCLAESSAVRAAPLFVAVDLQAGARRERSEALVHIASAVRPAWLREAMPQLLRRASSVELDEAGGRVVAVTRLMFADLVLDEERRVDAVEPADAQPLLIGAALRDPERFLGDTSAADALCARLAFLAQHRPELALPENPSPFFAAAVEAAAAGCRSFAELRRADLAQIMRGLLTRPQVEALNSEAPERVALPSGRSAAIVYQPDRPPAVAAKIQELFGLAATPRLAAGRVPLVVELLAPNGRPAQVTDDLASFWRNTYPEVRKQLRGRYPKHDWPEDPTRAPPSRGVRRKRD